MIEPKPHALGLWTGAPGSARRKQATPAGCKGLRACQCPPSMQVAKDFEAQAFTLVPPGGGQGAQQAQRGVMRVNCIDCLDRTNVVQGVLARKVRAVFFHPRHAWRSPLGLSGEGWEGRVLRATPVERAACKPFCATSKPAAPERVVFCRRRSRRCFSR